MRTIPTLPESTLQLLLFIDDRPKAKDLVKEVEEFLQREKACPSELQIINVAGQPQLAELFKVVMSPALLKLSPLPRQTIAGKNLLKQLENCWDTWKQQVLEQSTHNYPPELSQNIEYMTELAHLADDVFRLSQEKSEIEEQLRFKDRVLGMLAHDLRNPLTAILLAIDTIEKSGDKIEPQMVSRLLKHARNKARDADNLITDILEAGRGANAKFRTQRQKIQFDQLCHSVISDFYFNKCLEGKMQKLIKDIPTDLPPVYIDQEKIRQVLINLLGNATKYTPEGGKIELTVMHRTAQKIEVSITDNGPGIPAELRDRVFEERYRLERDDEAEGYGIGLSLCRRIITAHYGHIWVDDAIGKKGSCFRFTLPVY
ncbi:histidine kinase [Pseudanabaena sp. ABRG5-3]|uniref:histidine kinase n=1 Tax=Pseudanabaena sp. ABRG5-3 TaxID=685565 RepID=UPI000DC71BD8|nr:histidine kinase [Pseudanabaena sp. ABRG5-3]BBC23235.1 adaptive-response sensory histidine kinase [Pseudanabaena sp. ABRG5-3]